MSIIKNDVLRIILLSCVLLIQPLYGSYGSGWVDHKPVSIEINSSQAITHLGEPLFLKVTYQFDKPPRNADTNDILSEISGEIFTLVELKDNDKDWLAKYHSFTPFETDGVKFYPTDFKVTSSILNVQGEQGLEYSTYFLISYHPFKKDFVFSESGIYRICVTDNQIFSNIINLEVVPNTTETTCTLPDPNDYRFLMGEISNLYKDADSYSKTIANLKNIIKRCPNSLLAKLAAARLGVESQRVDEIERSKARRERREPSRLLFIEANEYYRKALELPDDFPIRQQILWQLAEFEMLDKNYQQAFSYVTELNAKYPKSKYGKKAVEAKKELEELKIKEKNKK
jgi:tetratricopeptide (TPR) repeat protein